MKVKYLDGIPKLQESIRLAGISALRAKMKPFMTATINLFCRTTAPTAVQVVRCEDCLFWKSGKNEMNDKIPYAGILEDGIRKLTEGKAQNAVLCGLLEDGTTCVAYANASPEDLANIACHLLSEAFMRMVIANIGMVKDALDEYEDEEGGESNG